ncbi:MAG: bifunctional adenosylcobinamide kinase/adenosylcobinamide-phosphate guanylyltransferase [Synechococcaceae cyanobacterium SM2_3_1]|nr:bifunctional adenosylcobinamide kinase/adenosylcobinamide-phosphate guanylyltransferase [Synechococcaceae cyanobacterium SM2_3_1]
MTTILITGPTRSGKSVFAEQLAHQSQRPVIYIATTPSPDTGEDPEWAARIQQHRQRRPAEWITWEEPDQLAAALFRCPPTTCCLVDSLGAWVANHLDASAAAWQDQMEGLKGSLLASDRLLLLVAEEVGWGVIPAYASGRLFRDRLGELVQQVGQQADQVFLVVAGYALDVKKWGQPISSTQ